MLPPLKKPISYLEENATQLADEMKRTRQPMVITQNGEASLVVQDVQSWERTQQTLALLKILALGKQQIKAGEHHGLADVLAELDREPGD